METRTREVAEDAGYAVFNRGPHICVDIPDGNSTVTCRTSTGELLTFAFVPYEDGGPPKCVYVHHRTAKRVFCERPFGEPGAHTQELRPASPGERPAMNVICFSGGRDAYRSVDGADAAPTTLVGILLY